ncbi:hypothetical protein SEVIR_1G264400v4 [Setaria viridis]|uniref:PHD-type zinc finger plants domain-containing protein n=2 Tax=Setaria TaxID=4554 RepID=A0A368PQB7_SETIT|nr:uncharacterized protein LOC101753554 [Setaria italica]XP_034605264.1 uncharacterized protein LOC117865219 [Setaria viridis]RCV07628.1 hypothetical protein SETIT_1G260100v2 [Setaria italica]TKW40721.1 hypothetical protein SEVIR_1G264400v2 [Setaria viridis]
MAGTTVCSMCGDVGFADKLFRCARCRRRFQHSYCTNYYGDAAPAEAGAGVCDWCLSDDVGGSGGKKRPYNSSAASGCSKQQQAAAAAQGRSEQQAFPTISGCGKGAGKVTGGELEAGGRRARRYKLLKDVLC